MGKKAIFIGPMEFDWFQPIRDRILTSLDKAGVEVVDVVKSAAPNAPFVDVYRIHSHIMHKKPDVLVVADSGSGIDATKAAATLATLGELQPEIDPFFGVGQVTRECQEAGRTIMPVVAVEVPRIATVAACTAAAVPHPAMTARVHLRNGERSVMTEAVMMAPATTAAGVAIVSSRLSSQGM